MMTCAPTIAISTAFQIMSYYDEVTRTITNINKTYKVFYHFITIHL